MKKTLFVLCTLCMLMVSKALAYEWTDGNGVKWTFDLNGTSATIRGAANYGENVTVPQTVYNGETACTVVSINCWRNIIFSNGTNVTLPSTIISIGSYILSNAGTIKVNSADVPSLASDAFGAGVTVLVPAAYLSAYRNADGWKDISVRIISQSAKTDYTINATAQASSSGIHQVIGEENLGNVMSLTVSGSINSYDIMIIRNKMYNLHHLDLTNANIVANDYKYYDNYYTTDNVLGNFAFGGMTKLITAKLPNSINSIGNTTFSACVGLKSVIIGNNTKSIGEGAFYNCSSLTSVTIPNSVTSIGYQAFYMCIGLTSVTIGSGVTSIGGSAFEGCSGLTSVTIPKSVTSIGGSAFCNCSGLTSVTIPNSVTRIGSYAFCGCSGLTSVTIPNSVTGIGSYAFSGCSGLTSIHLPSSLRSIGSSAFSYCTKLMDYYTYTVEPTSITESTFSNWTTATLHIPSLAYYNYYWDTQWSKFAFLVEDTEYKYDYFYLSNDFLFNSTTASINSNPNVDLNAGSGIIVESSSPKVELDDVHMAKNATASASIIANGNLTVENLYFDIDVVANKWYFLTFPFRVKLSNVTSPGNFVFRYYDGAARAQNGSGGWKNVTGSYLNAGQGYIFQTNTAGTLTLKVEKADMDFSGNGKQDALSTYAAENAANASWNFLGNPHTAYFDINETGYTAPITVWNGSAYQAVRAGDDSYYMQPFQAFFVQKPTGTSAVNFPASGRYTYKQTQNTAANARVATGSASTRFLVNLTIGSGEAIDDQTRVVFNDAKTADYEMDCDAAKFFGDGQVAQLYTLGQDGTQYAINERPQGEVALGFVAAINGELTIAAQRMDCPVYLRDNELNIVHDLSTGGYTFNADKGSNESRFVLVLADTTTGIANANTDNGINSRATYTLGGVKQPKNSQSYGVRIVKEGQKTTKQLSR